MSNNSSPTTGLPHSPPTLPFPYLTTTTSHPQSYYHNLPYSPSSSHSRQLSNLSCPPYNNHNILPSSSSPNTNPPPPPPPTPYYPLLPASYPPPPPPPPPLLPPSFFPYPPNIHSPISPSPLDHQALQAPSYYPNWQDHPYPPSSPPYESTYRPPYLAFRDAPPRPIDSPYPPPLAFSPTSSSHLQDASSPHQRTYPHPSPLQSPYTSPGPHTPHNSFRSPSHPTRHHSPRYPPFVHHHHRPTFSSASSPPIYHHLHHDAKSPPTNNTSPPPPAVSSESLVRGSLAQAKLRNHHLIKRTPPQLARQPIHRNHPPTTPPPKNSKMALHLQRPALPTPPSHSEHALWVGNVPNDASHEELWKFFTARTIPSSSASPPTAGVESIHLISRSNCAFVNYISDQHLKFAIESCNGKSLRQFDPRCKNLVCRVRKIEDNVKSGVGAQRIGGMHRAWIKKMAHINSMTQPPPPIMNQNLEKDADHDDDGIKNRMGSMSTFHSSNGASSGSTTSSFLSKHFSRRYFILKSYTEDDLKLSIERQVWASQSHNEPILDQAYRTSPQGIYLIFSVNRSGEFYGYARMTGPIWRRPSIRPASVPNSPVSRPAPLALGLGLGGVSGGGATGRRASVSGSLELHEALTGSPLDDGIAGHSRVTTASPAPLSPSLRSGVGGAAAGMLGVPILPHISSSSSNARSLPEPITIKKDIHHHAHRQVTEEIQVQDEGEEDGDSVYSSGGNHRHHNHSARPFDIEWIKVQRLPFHLTRDLKNPFNGHREVKVSRDGTEIEPSIGAELLARIDAAATSL